MGLIKTSRSLETSIPKFNYTCTFVVGRGSLLICLLIHTLQLNIEPNHTTLAGHGYEHDVVLASKQVFTTSNSI